MSARAASHLKTAGRYRLWKHRLVREQGTNRVSLEHVVVLDISSYILAQRVERRQFRTPIGEVLVERDVIRHPYGTGLDVESKVSCVAVSRHADIDELACLGSTGNFALRAYEFEHVATEDFDPVVSRPTIMNSLEWSSARAQSSVQNAVLDVLRVFHRHAPEHGRQARVV